MQKIYFLFTIMVLFFQSDCVTQIEQKPINHLTQAASGDLYPVSVNIPDTWRYDVLNESADMYDPIKDITYCGYLEIIRIENEDFWLALRIEEINYGIDFVSSHVWDCFVFNDGVQGYKVIDLYWPGVGYVYMKEGWDIIFTVHRAVDYSLAEDIAATVTFP